MPTGQEETSQGSGFNWLDPFGIGASLDEALKPADDALTSILKGAGDAAAGLGQGVKGLGSNIILVIVAIAVIAAAYLIFSVRKA